MRLRFGFVVLLALCVAACSSRKNGQMPTDAQALAALQAVLAQQNGQLRGGVTALQVSNTEWQGMTLISDQEARGHAILTASYLSFGPHSTRLQTSLTFHRAAAGGWVLDHLEFQSLDAQSGFSGSLEVFLKVATSTDAAPGGALREARAALKDPATRAQGLRDLATLGPEAKPALPDIIQIIKRPVPASASGGGDLPGYEVTNLIDKVIGKMGAAAVPALVKELETNDEKERLAIAGALAAAGPTTDQALVPLLNAMRRTQDPEVKKRYVPPLGHMKRAAVPALVALMMDDAADGESLAVAAGALGWIGEMENDSPRFDAARALLRAADVPDSRVCAAVVQALGDGACHGPYDEVVVLLLKKLDDPNRDVRMGAANALYASQLGRVFYRGNTGAVPAALYEKVLLARDALGPDLDRKIAH